MEFLVVLMFIGSKSSFTIWQLAEVVLAIFGCGLYGYGNPNRWGILSAVALFICLFLLIIGA